MRSHTMFDIFVRKFGEDKPCLICRHYYDCEGCILWEHEIEVDEMPKKNDFEFKNSWC